MLDTQLQFGCRALLVDNPTNQYIFLTQPNRFVPPNTHGVIVPMTGGQALQARFQSPVGISPAVTITGQFATLIALDSDLPASSGSLQPVGSQATQQYLGRVTVPANSATTHQGIFQLPEGTHGVALLAASNGAGGGATMLIDLFNVDAFVEWGTYPAGGADTMTVPLASGSKYKFVPLLQKTVASTNNGPPINSVTGQLYSQIVVNMTPLNGVAATVDAWVDVYAVLIPQAVIVTTNPGEALPVSGSVSITGNPPASAPNPGMAAAPVNVANLAGNGTSTIIAAVLNQTINLYTGWLENQAVDTVVFRLEDTNGTGYGNFLAIAIGTVWPINFNGVALPVSKGLRLKNTSGSSLTGVTGSIMYTQA